MKFKLRDGKEVSLIDYYQQVKFQDETNDRFSILDLISALRQENH